MIKSNVNVSSYVTLSLSVYRGEFVVFNQLCITVVNFERAAVTLVSVCQTLHVVRLFM